MDITADPSDRVTPGSTITFTASAAGGTGDYEYKFYFKGPSTDNSWQVVQDYSASNSWTWQTGTDNLCKNDVKVYARSTDSCEHKEAYKYIYVTVTPESATDVSITADPSDTVTPGSTITFTASAAGGTGDYEYKFYRKGPSTGDSWQVVQDYSASDSWTWQTGTDDLCNNYIKVYARSTGSCAHKEAYKYIHVTVTPEPATDVTLSALPSASTPAGGTVTVKAVADGGTGEYQYKFYLKGPSTDHNWLLVRDYSSADTWIWQTTINDAGAYEIKAKARSLGSCAYHEAYAYIYYTLTEPATNVSINADPVEIPSGGSSVLTWQSTQAETASIDQGIGTVPVNGTIDVSPIETTTYTITVTGTEGSATASVTVAMANTPPTANPGSVTTTEDTSISITLTGSDTDNDPLTYQVGSTPGHGTLSGTVPDLTYTPDANYNGPDSFAFTATDGHTESDIATISITVLPVNDPPLAVDDAYTTDENQPITTGNVLANDMDNDGDDLAISGFTQAANGTVTSHGDGTFTYTPNSGFSGSDSFDYTVSDGNGGSDTATVTIQVIAGSLDVTITSPAEGAQFTTDTITVTGSVSNTNAAVFVNGVAATVNGNEFTAENVPLVPGANTISVLAEDGTHTAVASITVMLLTAIDLEPVQIEITAIPENDGSLKVSGQATVTVANNGSSDVTTPYHIVLFEDTNVSGSYEETEDNLLGQETVPIGPGAGEATNIPIEFVGELLFRDNRMHVFVDSTDDVEESDEANNITATQAGGIDLSASLLRLDDAACPDGVTLIVRIGNAGSVSIPQGVSVAFYDGEPGNGGVLIGTVLSTQALEPGHYEDLTLQWTEPSASVRSIYARADDDGTGTGLYDEVNEENNRVVSPLAICTAPPATEGISGQVIDAVTGDFLSGAAVFLHTDDGGQPGAMIDQYTSDEHVGFVFSGLNAGTYFLSADLQGYMTGERRVILASGETLTHQDIVLSPVLGSDEFRIVLTWGEQPADLEAHLTAPNPDGCRHHCFYWNEEIAGAHLDLDDKDSYGPETITITQKDPGTYRFYVHDFTNRLSSSSNALADSEATLTVYSGAGDDPMTFPVPSGPGTVWHVFNLDGETGAVTPIDKLTYQSHPGQVDFPQITSTPLRRVILGEAYTYQVMAVDPDLGTLLYSIVKGPTGMTIDPLTGLVEWTPTSAQGGRWHEIEIRVDDGRCGQDTQIFRIYVTYLPSVQFTISPCPGINPGGDITLTSMPLN